MTEPTTRYRRRPLDVDAVQWHGERNCEDVFAFLGMGHPDDETDHSVIDIDAPGCTATAQPGDWIVRNESGEYSVWAADLFAATYERAAVSSPPPDQTAVEGIADTVTPFLANFSDEETARINAREVAAAVLAVLPPPADRAAVLHEAADAVQSHPGPHRDELQPDAPGFWWDTRDRDAAADLLRRLAGETPAATEADRCPHGCNTSTCPCLACEDDEPAPPREPHPTEADLRHAQAVLARFEGRDTVEPSAGVRQDGAQTEADRIVAYSSVGSLFCTKCCTGDPDSRSTPVTSEDLPDGGLCDECGVDVLIPQEPSS